MTPQDIALDGSVIRFDTSIVASVDAGLFDVTHLRAQGVWRDSTQGRSQAHFFEYAGREMVLRHFHRGGLIGRVNRDLYLRTHLENSRPMREFDLLAQMHGEGLPVPLPVAARFVPRGLFYSADIITQRIPDAVPLQEVLQQRALSELTWADIGLAVRNLHDHGVFHSDLNCRNILLDARERTWFIDFDKCDKRPAGAWMQGTLDRLNRSLRKSAAGAPAFHWADTDWHAFMAGYHSTDAAA